LLVELVVIRDVEGANGLTVDSRRLEVDGVEVFVREPQALVFEPFTPVAVRLVRERDAQHPKRDRLAVDGRLELGLDGRDLLLVRACQVAEVALAGEAPELDRRAGEPL